MKDPHEESEGASAAERRLSRRGLIKRAAATGAVAWTAPLIVESLMSPAAAATCVGTTLPATYSTGGDDARSRPDRASPRSR